MKLLLRYKKILNNIEADEVVEVSNQKEWFENIYNPELVSSVLIPDSKIFKISYNVSLKRKHAHERFFKINQDILNSYFSGCLKIAWFLNKNYSGANILVYAPLRGAYPIWKIVSKFLKDIKTTVYFPVTSSFIFYPEEFNINGKSKKKVSCRYNNIFELKRLYPLFQDFDYFLYIDEIVSGGMMVGYLKEMLKLKINKEIKIIAVGLADNYGNRAKLNIEKIKDVEVNRKIDRFFYEGCRILITQDNKFLLGIHYVDYEYGPHIVPFLDENGEFYEDKKRFERMGNVCLKFKNMR